MAHVGPSFNVVTVLLCTLNNLWYRCSNNNVFHGHFPLLLVLCEYSITRKHPFFLLVFWRPSHSKWIIKNRGFFLCYLFGKLKIPWEMLENCFSYSSQILVFVYLKEDKCFIIKWLHDAFVWWTKIVQLYEHRWTIDEAFHEWKSRICKEEVGGLLEVVCTEDMPL